MTEQNKEIIKAVVELLQSTLGDMPSRQADEIVAATMKILITLVGLNQ